MTEFIANLMMSDLFIPHGHCYLWNTELVGLHLVSDLTIAIAYFSIPLTLFYFVEQREDLPFNWIFTLFGAFIILCGTTHLLEVWTLWHPVYWLSGTVKAITAIVSAYTAFVLVRLIPQALKLPSPAQLEAANRELQQQIRDRELVEAQIQQLNEELEARVAARTQELAASTLQAEDLAERLSLAIDGAQLGTYDWDLVADKLITSAYFNQLMGFPPDVEFTLADWKRILHPEDFSDATTGLEQAFGNLSDLLQEYRIIWPDGSVHWIGGFGRFYCDNDGRATRMAGGLSDITDRKQTERALQSSERRYRALIEATTQIIWSTRADGYVVAEQPSWGAFTGQSFDEYQGWNWLAAIHPDDRARTDELWLAAVTNLTTYEIEHRLRRYDGEYRQMSVRAIPILGGDGSVREWVGIHTDVTDRRQDEANLRRSEEFNRRILENNKDRIEVLDLEGQLLYTNDGGKKLMGIADFTQYDRALWMELWGGTDRESANLAWQVAKGGNTSQFEGQCPTVMGAPKWWQVTVAPMLDDRGNVEQILSISHDITDRIQSELAIRESEDRFRSTFEQAAVGVAHVDLDGRWLLVNQKLCGIVGYSEAELLGTNFQDISYPEDIPADLEAIRQIMAGEIQIIKLEKRYLHKSGRIVWIGLTAALRRSNTGEPLYFIASFEDISDRKESEFVLQAQTVKLAETTALVEQRNQELDRFTHIVSHDLKAPLRGIANLAEWIEDDLAGEVDPDTQKNLELMRSRVYRMEKMITGLLQYARVGNTESSSTTFAIAELLHEIVDSLSLADSFVLELPGDLPPITTNRILLERVLANLIGNACKHHDRTEGRIIVTAQPRSDDLWEFAVTDDGPGISPENHERVFGIFQTLSDTAKENTGIGLSIVKKIVETQGGHITIECPLPRGTTFRFTWRSG